MSNNIHKLNVVKDKNPPNEHIIELLRELLRSAKTGEIQAISIACAVVDNSDHKSDNGRSVWTNHVFTKGWWHSSHSALFALLSRVLLDREKLTEDIDMDPLTDDDE